MNIFHKIACIGGLMLAASPAAADEPTAGTTVGLDPADAVSEIAIVEGPGFKVGEGTVLHTSVGLETGVISNVFYENDTPVASALMRLIAQAGIGTLSAQRLAALEGDANTEARTNMGSFQYRADAHLDYNIHLSGNDKVTEQNGLGAGFLLNGVVRPQQALSFAFLEDYQRVIRAANFESAVDTNRDINKIRLGFQYKPYNRTLNGTLFYENMIDFFERESQRFANRFINTLTLRVNWRRFPKTNFFGEVSQGIVSGLGDAATKVTAYPLTPVVGVQTLLTANTGLSARVGYTNGFYSDGPSYSTVVAGVQFGYRYSPLGGVGLGYSYHHEDSINANFYRDHMFTLSVSQQFVPFLIVAALDLRLRHYEGITIVMTPTTERDDFIASVTGGMRYNFRNWLATTLDYQFTAIQTDFRYMTPDGLVGNPSYLRHQLLAGVRAAF